MHQNSFLLFFFFSFFLNFLIAPPLLLPLELPSLPAAPFGCWPSRRTGFSWRLTDLTSSSIVYTSASLAVSNPKLAKPSGFSSFRLPKRVRTGKKENLGCRWNLKHHQQCIKEVETDVLEVFIIWRDSPWTGKEASSAHKHTVVPKSGSNQLMMLWEGKLKQSWPLSLRHVQKPKHNVAVASIIGNKSIEDQQLRLFSEVSVAKDVIPTFGNRIWTSIRHWVGR